MNVFPQNRTFWRQKKLRAVARVTNLFGNGNWLGPVMDLFGRLLDLSLENNAFLAALMDLFQKISSRLIKLIVTAHPNLSWDYGIFVRSMDQLNVHKCQGIMLTQLLCYGPWLGFEIF
jgi:hypothetical protein